MCSRRPRPTLQIDPLPPCERPRVLSMSRSPVTRVTLEMFKQMAAGAFGPLDLSKVIMRGFSGGAQMVSWMIQKIAVGEIKGVGMAGGVLLSGGSYNCYQTPPLARGVCKACNTSCGHHSGQGCSDDMHQCLA